MPSKNRTLICSAFVFAQGVGPDDWVHSDVGCALLIPVSHGCESHSVSQDGAAMLATGTNVVPAVPDWTYIWACPRPRAAPMVFLLSLPSVRSYLRRA